MSVRCGCAPSLLCGEVIVSPPAGVESVCLTRSLVGGARAVLAVSKQKQEKVHSGSDPAARSLYMLEVRTPRPSAHVYLFARLLYLLVQENSFSSCASFPFPSLISSSSLSSLLFSPFSLFLFHFLFLFLSLSLFLSFSLMLHLFSFVLFSFFLARRSTKLCLCRGTSCAHDENQQDLRSQSPLGSMQNLAIRERGGRSWPLSLLRLVTSGAPCVS